LRANGCPANSGKGETHPARLPSSKQSNCCSTSPRTAASAFRQSSGYIRLVFRWRQFLRSCGRLCLFLTYHQQHHPRLDCSIAQTQEKVGQCFVLISVFGLCCRARGKDTKLLDLQTSRTTVADQIFRMNGLATMWKDQNTNCHICRSHLSGM